MEKKSIAVLTIIMVAVFPGCISGIPGSPTETVKETDSGCGAHLLLNNASSEEIEDADIIIEYSNMSSENQSVFLEALNNGSAKIENSLDSMWRNRKDTTKLIEYNGTKYFPWIAVC